MRRMDTTETELRILGRLVSGYFNFAETQAMRHNKMYMKDYVAHLDRILSSNGDEVLDGAGRISREQALKKANAEYQKFITQNLSPVEEAYLQTVKCAEREIKANQ